MEELRKRAEEHCGKGIPREAQLLELGWMTEKVVVSYLTCKCREKESHVEDNQGQGVILFWKWKELSWYGCKGEAARPREAKVQQSSTWSGEPESVARKRESGAPTERKSAAREGGS